MLSTRNQASVVEHHDLIRQRDRREPVGDHERRASRHRLGQSELDALLGGGIHGRGRVVEHQHPRVREQRPGDRQPLSLTARQRQAPLPDLGLVALGQPADELVRLGAPGGLFDLPAGGVWVRVGDVLRDAGGEQEGVVADDRHRLPHGADRDVADVDAVEQHLAFAGVIQPRDQRHEAGLAGAGGTHDRDRAAGRNVEVDVVQDGAAGGEGLGRAGRQLVVGGLVTERDPPQLDVPAAGGQVAGAGQVDHPRFTVQQLEDPRARGRRALGEVERHPQRAHRRDEHVQVQVEGGELAQREVRVDHALPPIKARRRAPAGAGRRSPGCSSLPAW